MHLGLTDLVDPESGHVNVNCNESYRGPKYLLIDRLRKILILVIEFNSQWTSMHLIFYVLSLRHKDKTRKLNTPKICYYS